MSEKTIYQLIKELHDSILYADTAKNAMHKKQINRRNAALHIAMDLLVECDADTKQYDFEARRALCVENIAWILLIA